MTYHEQREWEEQLQAHRHRAAVAQGVADDAVEALSEAKRTQRRMAAVCADECEQVRAQLLVVEGQRDELLAACRAVLECLGRTLAPDYLPEPRELLRAAIAKADGG